MRQTKRLALVAILGALVLPAWAELRCFAPDGKIVEVNEIIDDEIAFAKHAETAGVVAFDRLPRPNILHSWKSLGVTVLKTLRNDPEMSPERFRREAGFLAFRDGADGIYLAGAKPAGDYARALDEAKEDWRVLEYARSLGDRAMASDDGLIRIEGRRATYYLQGIFPADWENLDCMRLECTAWAKRLEQILGVSAAKLPTTVPANPLPEFATFKPYDAAAPDTVNVGGEGKSVKLGEGLEFRWDAIGFSLTVETHKGRELPSQWASPGGALDFRIYIPGKKPGEWLPYRYHCDLNPLLKGTVRAPARGRGSFLYGTDERFIPYDQAYESHNNRVMEWPRLRTHGPDCPDLRPRLTIEPVKGGGYRASLRVDWLSLYGRWPMQGSGTRGDTWFVGVDRMPDGGEPIAVKLIWPKPNATLFERFCGRFAPGAITTIYKEELARTNERWLLGLRDHYYRFLKTKEPCYNSGDYESDEMFRTRLEQPLVDANMAAWEMIWNDKDHPNPTLRKQTPAVQASIHKMLGRMLYLSHTVGLLRRDYLAGRFAGKVPPEPAKKKDNSDASPATPDADFDEEAISLDDKEF